MGFRLPIGFQENFSGVNSHAVQLHGGHFFVGISARLKPFRVADFLCF